jgi:hypothetical protein
MVGDSSGQREGSRSTRKTRVARKRILNADGEPVSKGTVTSSPEEIVAIAVSDGRLDQVQAEVLENLLSRTHLLGFENRKIISVLVNNIALEKAQERRKDLVQQLRDFLDSDELAKDLVPSLSAAFAIR